MNVLFCVLAHNGFEFSSRLFLNARCSRNQKKVKREWVICVEVKSKECSRIKLSCKNFQYGVDPYKTIISNVNPEQFIMNIPRNLSKIARHLYCSESLSFTFQKSQTFNCSQSRLWFYSRSFGVCITCWSVYDSESSIEILQFLVDTSLVCSRLELLTFFDRWLVLQRWLLFRALDFNSSLVSSI